MIRLAVRVRREHAELVLAELLELAPGGLEEAQPDEHTVEYAVYGAPGELPRLPDLRAAAGGALIDVSTLELPDDWPERWKRFHRPVLIPAPAGGARAGPPGGLRVRPPWEPPPASADADTRDIVIDPGQAFGTGAHHTTRLCLELLLELAAHSAAPGALLDVGTGSGVIAIAAARLGFQPVLALDNDPHSVSAARHNASANGLALDVLGADLRAGPLPWIGGRDRPAGTVTVVANLLAPLLAELARRIARPPEQLLAGGLLATEADEVAGMLCDRLRMRERTRRTSGEWSALWLTRDARPDSEGDRPERP